MAQSLERRLSRRERPRLDYLFQHGSATVARVRLGIPDAPSYSAVRALLGILEQKGHVRHREDGPRYVYEPTESRENARKSALRHMVRIFFDGSLPQAVAGLLELSDRKLSGADADQLAVLIQKARAETR